MAFSLKGLKNKLKTGFNNLKGNLSALTGNYQIKDYTAPTTSGQKVKDLNTAYNPSINYNSPGGQAVAAANLNPNTNYNTLSTQPTTTTKPKGGGGGSSNNTSSLTRPGVPSGANPSIVDYLNSKGFASDFNSRANLALEKGIQNYTGTASQNEYLLLALQNPGTKVGSSTTAITLGAAPTYNEPVNIASLSTPTSPVNLPSAPSAGLSLPTAASNLMNVGATDASGAPIVADPVGNQEQDKYTKMMEDAIGNLQAPERTDYGREAALESSGYNQALKEANDISNQISAINADTESKKLSLIGQGRGIPEAIIGGQQAKLDREAAIKTMPLTAQYKAAVGLVDAAKEIVNNFVADERAYQSSLQQWQNNVYQATYQYASAQQKIAIEEQRRATDRQYELEDQFLQDQTDYFKMTLETGQKEVGSQIMKARSYDELYSVASKIKGTSGGGVTDEEGVISPYQQERITRNLDSIAELKPRVTWQTVGAFGAPAGYVPGSVARDFKMDVNTLIANITFGELTAMREASKTGGALGQVSDRENQLLGAALGALSTSQSPANFRKNLDKIEESIKRWQTAVGQYAVTPDRNVYELDGQTYKQGADGLYYAQ